MKNTKDSKKGMKDFLDLKAPIYRNKNNGQISILIPKKELMKMMDRNKNYRMSLPKILPIQNIQMEK